VYSTNALKIFLNMSSAFAEVLWEELDKYPAKTTDCAIEG
jgi:hypothetical protein